MDNEKAKQQRLLINDLLDRCNGCPYQACTDNRNWKSSCKGCPNYDAIRAAGDKLAEMEDTGHAIVMTVEEYEKLAISGQSDVDIAISHNGDYYDLQRWKKQNRVTRPINTRLTVDEYSSLHNAGVSDKEIARLKKVPRQQILRWKKQNHVNTKCPDEKIRQALEKGIGMWETARTLRVGYRRVKRMKEEMQNETDNG